MQYSNSIEFALEGRFALFSDPVNRVGGEKLTYMIPTYQSLKGICESIYWKPTIVWHVDALRVMKPIQTQSKGIRPLKYNGGNDLAIYTYLYDVEYRVRAHFEWNEHRADLAADRDEHKHYLIARRMLERGGRRDIFLGTRECQGYVQPVAFDEGEGAYDKTPELAFGVMFHSFAYPDETGRDELSARLWRPVMKKGEVSFCRPEECTLVRRLRDMKAKPFTLGEDVLSAEEEEGRL